MARQSSLRRSCMVLVGFRLPFQAHPIAAVPRDWPSNTPLDQAACFHSSTAPCRDTQETFSERSCQGGWSCHHINGRCERERRYEIASFLRPTCRTPLSSLASFDDSRLPAYRGLTVADLAAPVFFH